MTMRPQYIFLVATLACEAGTTVALECRPFRRGDTDGDGSLTVLDAVTVIRASFLQAAPPLSCVDAADADDNGRVDARDAVFLLNVVFSILPRTERLFPFCRVDQTPDGLTCDLYGSCRDFVDEVADSLGDSGATVFVIDRSPSMTQSGELDIAKRTVNRLVCTLEEDVAFGVLFVDRGVLGFPSDGVPVEATEFNKTHSDGFVRSTSGGDGYCIRQGLLAALEMLDRAPVDDKSMLLIASPPLSCGEAVLEQYLEETLRIVREQNTDGVRIDVVPTHGDNDFLRELAQQSDGVYYGSP